MMDDYHLCAMCIQMFGYAGCACSSNGVRHIWTVVLIFIERLCLLCFNLNVLQLKGQSCIHNLDAAQGHADGTRPRLSLRSMPKRL